MLRARGGRVGGSPTTPPSAGPGHLRGDHVAWEQGPRRAAPARSGLTRASPLFDLLRARSCCEDGISLAAIPLRQRCVRRAGWCRRPHERPVAVERRPRSGGVRGLRVPGWRDERRLSSLRCHSGVLCQVWTPSEGVWVWEGCRVVCVWGRVYASYGRRAGWPRNLPTYLLRNLDGQI